MAQEKLDTIKGIFNERLTAMALKEGPRDLRMKRSNSLIKSAINNILIGEKKAVNALRLNVQPNSSEIKSQSN